MRVIHLVRGKANPNRGNGVGKMVHFLATEQARLGVATEVWGITQGERAPSFDSEYKFEAIPAKKIGLDRAFSQKIDSIKDKGNLIFVLHGPFITDFWFASRILKVNKIKYIFMPHDQYNSAFFEDRVLLKTIYFRLIEKTILKNADAIQLLHKDHAVLIENLGVSNKTIVFPNGIAADEVWNGVDEHELRPFTFFYLGRLDIHNKGLDILLEAFKKSELAGKARLVLQGSGPTAVIKTIIEELKVESVEVLPPNFNKISADLIRAGDVFCLVSRFEGFGLVALESMSAARPIIISKVAGISEYIREAGCGVEVTPDVASVTNALIRMYENKSELAAMGLRGKEYAFNHLASDKIAKDITAKYSAILNA